MQQLNESMNQNKLARAEKQAEEILQFTEQTWGKKHMNYGLLLGIPVATLYEMKGDQKQLEKVLQTSAQILRTHGDEYLVETNVADKLVNVYSAQKRVQKGR